MLVNSDIAAGRTAAEIERIHHLKQNAGFDFIHKYKEGLKPSELIYEALFLKLNKRLCRMGFEELKNYVFTFSQVMNVAHTAVFNNSLNSKLTFRQIAVKHDICLATVYNRHKSKIRKNKR